MLLGSGVSGLPQLSLPNSHPAESPTARVFYSDGSCLLQVSDSSRPSRLSLSRTNFLQQGPRILASARPISHPRQQYPSQTTIISVFVDSFIQAIQDEQCVHSYSPSHTHTFTFHINGLVTPQQLGFWLSPPAGAAI